MYQQWFEGGRGGACARVRGLASVLLLLGGILWHPVSVRAGDWLTTDLPFVDPVPLRLSTSQWVRLSVHTGAYRTAVEQAGDRSVTRTLALLPSLVLTPPSGPLHPFIGAGVGLSVTELTPGVVHDPLRLDQRLVMQVGAGIAYDLGRGWALTSSARFAEFKSANLLGALSDSLVALPEAELDFHNYMVEFGVRLSY